MDEGDGDEQATGEPPTRGARGGVRPDIMILEGWPETSSPPGGPTKTYKKKPHTSGDDLKMKAPREPHESPRGDDMMRADKRDESR
jgi:hypothetical protein